MPLAILQFRQVPGGPRGAAGGPGVEAGEKNLTFYEFWINSALCFPRPQPTGPAGRHQAKWRKYHVRRTPVALPLESWATWPGPSVDSIEDAGTPPVLTLEN